MGSEEDKHSKRPGLPFGDDEDSYADIWSRVEGADRGEDEGSEAFTEFAPSPDLVLRRSSLRRKAPPAAAPGPPGPPDDTTADAPNPLIRRPQPAPGEHHTADDVRSLLEKVMEEALPTNPNAQVGSGRAFPEDGAETLRPAEAAVDRSVARDTSTQLVDAESVAMDHAVGVGRRPASFDALPAALSDEVKQAPKVLRGQPAKDLSHLTDDLSMDVVATARHPEVPSATPAVPPPEAPPPLLAPTVTLPEDEPSLELAYEPARAPAPSAPDPDRLLDEVTPRSTGKLMIGLAVALLGLLLFLVVKSLL